MACLVARRRASSSLPIAPQASSPRAGCHHATAVARRSAGGPRAVQIRATEHPPCAPAVREGHGHQHQLARDEQEAQSTRVHRAPSLPGPQEPPPWPGCCPCLPAFRGLLLLHGGSALLVVGAGELRPSIPLHLQARPLQPKQPNKRIVKRPFGLGPILLTHRSAQFQGLRGIMERSQLGRGPARQPL